MLAHPLYAILVEQPQVARLVIANQRTDISALLLVLGHIHGLPEPVDDFADDRSVFSSGKPFLLLQLGLALHERAVQSVGDGLRIVGILHGAIEIFHLLLTHVLIEVACRGFHHIGAVGLVHALGQHLGIEYHREQLLVRPEVFAND